MDIVKRIKQKCAEKGTTMGTLEKELGFANGSIRRWDERVPGADRVLILANRLEISVDWLLTGKESGNLTPEEQKIMTQAAKTATEYAREQSDARIFDRIATIEASGTAILTLSDETRDAIREAAGSVYESIRENIDPEIYDAYMEP